MPKAVTFAALGILYWTTHSMLRPLIGTHVLDLGGSHLDVGVVLASYSILPALIAVLIGAIADRWGNRRLLITGGVLMVLGSAVLLIPTLATVFASQVIIGLGTISVWVSLQTFATRSSDEGETRERRTARIATFSLFVAVGQSIGPAVGGLLQTAGGYPLAFGTYVGLAAMLTACAAAFAPRDAERASSPRSGRLMRAYVDAARLLRKPTVIATVATSFTALVVFDVRTAWLPLLLHGNGMPQWQIGVVISVGAIAGFAARPFFSRFLSAVGPPVMVAGVLVIAAGGATAVVIAPGDFVFVASMSAVSGFAVGFAQPLTLTLLSDDVPHEQLGLASGLRTMANQTAMLASPAVFGAIAGVATLGVGFIVVGSAAAAVGLGSSLVLAIARRRSRSDGEAAKKRPTPVEP